MKGMKPYSLIRALFVMIFVLSAFLPTINTQAAPPKIAYNHYENITNLWTAGIANANQADYSEGEVTPHWAFAQNLVIGDTYGFYIFYNFYQSTSNACGFDRFDTYNITITPPILAGVLDPQADPTALWPFSANVGQGNLTTSPNVNSLTIAANSIFDGAVNPMTADTNGYLRVTFTIDSGTSAEFYWGLHLALDQILGNNCAAQHATGTPTNGAGSFTGGSLQTKLATDSTPVEQNKPAATWLSTGSLQLSSGVVKIAALTGFKYNDFDGDGTRDFDLSVPPIPTEPGLEGWTINLYDCGGDANCAGITPGTTIPIATTLTGTNGSYSLQYIIGTGPSFMACEVLQTGWDNTEPGVTPPCHKFSFSGGTTVVRNFGNRQADLQIDKACPDYWDFESAWFDENIGKLVWSFPITVTNNGTAVAYGVYFSDILDTDIDYHSYVSSDPAVTCTFDTITREFKCIRADDPPPPPAVGFNPGASFTINLEHTVPEGYVDVDVNNSATVYSSVADPNLANNTDSCSATTPVTLAFFKASDANGKIRFEWTTASELGNAGFNLFVQDGKHLKKINPNILGSKKVSTLDPQSYSFEAAGVVGDTFYVQDVDVYGRKNLQGPFKLGEGFGNSAQPFRIDWAAVQAELNAAPSARSQSAVENAGSLYLPGVSKKIKAPNFPVVDIQVTADGMYRLSYEDIKAAGIDYKGADASAISVSNRGAAVPVFVKSSGKFGSGDFIEFYGEALKSLYSRTNVYQLAVKPGEQLAMVVDSSAPGAFSPASFYIETRSVHQDLAYNYQSPIGDPWYDTMMTAYGSPYSKDFNLNVDNYLPGAAPASLKIGTWGLGDSIFGDDHHLVVALNGAEVANRTFDSVAGYVVEASVPDGVLKEGANTLKLSLPFDTGAEVDMVMLDQYSLSYPRAFKALGNILTFKASAAKFQVDGLSSPNVVVFRKDANGMARLSNLVLTGSAGNYSVAFAGTGAEDTYFVYAADALLKPAGVALGAGTPDITSGKAQYLVISHPAFLNGLAPLLQARQAQGYTTRVVDVNHVYARFGYGIFDPQAIKDYIAYAAKNMGTEYVLLVGGDTYDYLGIEGDSISFIPTFYVRTDKYVAFSPADPVFADVNNDGVPELALGRFPVRTLAELSQIVEKTLAYDNKNYAGTAVFSADNHFGADSDAFIAKLPADWTIQKAYLDETASNVAAARTTLLGAMNSGVALASYVGHSAEYLWTFDGLFSTLDAAALTNNGKPMVVTQWGCFNTYFVSPNYDTLGHVFMLKGNQGAAAVLGSSTLSYAASEKVLGTLMMPFLGQSGVTIGAAMRDAKLSVPNNQQSADIMLGWTILGDPALVIQP